MEKTYVLFGHTYKKISSVAKQIDGILDNCLEIYEILRDKVSNKLNVHQKVLERKPTDYSKLSAGDKLVMELARDASVKVWNDVKSRKNLFHAHKMIDNYEQFMAIIEKKTDPNYIKDVVSVLDRLIKESYNEEIPEMLRVTVFSSQLESINYAIELLNEYKEYNAAHINEDAADDEDENGMEE